MESLHDGSFFHEKAKLWLFLPVAVVLLGLWLTGLYLFFLPYAVKRRRRRRERPRRLAKNRKTRAAGNALCLAFALLSHGLLAGKFPEQPFEVLMCFPDELDEAMKIADVDGI